MVSHLLMFLLLWLCSTSDASQEPVASYVLPLMTKINDPNTLLAPPWAIHHNAWNPTEGTPEMFYGAKSEVYLNGYFQTGDHEMTQLRTAMGVPKSANPTLVFHDKPPAEVFEASLSKSTVNTGAPPDNTAPTDTSATAPTTTPDQSTGTTDQSTGSTDQSTGTTDQSTGTTDQSTNSNADSSAQNGNGFLEINACVGCSYV